MHQKFLAHPWIGRSWMSSVCMNNNFALYNNNTHNDHIEWLSLVKRRGYFMDDIHVGMKYTRKPIEVNLFIMLHIRSERKRITDCPIHRSIIWGKLDTVMNTL